MERKVKISEEDKLDPNKSYTVNLLIHKREDNTPFLFSSLEGLDTGVIKLDGYAIIPLELYENLI